MSTNPTFNKEELKLLLITIYKIRSILFDCTELSVDPKSINKKISNLSKWKGKRGTFPFLEDIDKSLALLRLHVNSEEAIQLYEAMTKDI